MEKNQYELCKEVLRRLNERKLLGELILIGSWCVVFYKEYFSQTQHFSTIKTRDVDFLIPHPGRIKANIDIPDMLKDLGFVIGYSGVRGYMKLEHPVLIVEFLSPERGKGTNKPVPLPGLGINAIALRFLNFLTDNTIQASVGDFKVTLPHPANFALHKLIIAQRRRKENKAAKDNVMAFEILKALMVKGEVKKIKEVFTSVPLTWQKKIISVLEKVKEEEILEVLR